VEEGCRRVGRLHRPLQLEPRLRNNAITQGASATRNPPASASANPPSPTLRSWRVTPSSAPATPRWARLTRSFKEDAPSANSGTCLARVFFLPGISFPGRPCADIDIEARADKHTRCAALASHLENSQRKHRHLPSAAIRAGTRVQAPVSFSWHRPPVRERLGRAYRALSSWSHSIRCEASLAAQAVGLERCLRVHGIDCPVVFAMQEDRELLPDLLAFRVHSGFKQIVLSLLA
jgi:hypothetical protein